MDQLSGSGRAARIYPDLRERIALLELEPGTRLPEESLAREYEVSRTPIRSVLARLQHEGLLVAQGGGLVVAPIDPRQLRDVWTVRLKMAELLAVFLDLPADPQLVGRLRTLRAQAASVGDARGLGAITNAYHQLMMELIDSDTLRGIHDRLYYLTVRGWLQLVSRLDLDEEVEVLCEELDLAIEMVQQDSGEELASMWTHFTHRLNQRVNERLARPLVPE